MAKNPDSSTLATVVALVIFAAVLWFFWTPIWTVLSGAIQLSTTAVTAALSIAFSVAVSMVLFYFVVRFGLWLLNCLSEQLGSVGNQIIDLGKSLSEDTRRAGQDATFIALLATLSAAVAYAATGDFIDNLSTVRLLAVCGVGFCVAKLFIMLPSRVSKFGGLVLTMLILTGCLMFLNHRHHLIDDVGTGFSSLRSFLFPKEQDVADKQIIKLIVVATISLLSALAILYPFTPKQWRNMLTVGRP